MNEQASTLVVVVTGMSGAGKSTAVHALEDLGFFCVDNLPTPVVESTLAACARGGVRRVALGIDVRVGSFLEGATDVLDRIELATGQNLQVLFLDASDQALLRRFSSTRRPHPLSTLDEPGGTHAANAVLDGVRLERERLAPLRARSTLVVDTTRLSVHDLRRRVVGQYGPGAGAQPAMHTRFVSFGFKYGAPVDADLLFDVRFLQNPYFVDRLRDLPGTNDAVKNYVLSDPDTQQFVNHAVDMLEYCLPRFQREGKSYLTVCLGCTGGRHRSVVLAAHLAEAVAERVRLPIEVVHRDVGLADVERLSETDLIAPSGRPS